MKRVYDFLKSAKTYYLATAENDQPRVRPFGTVLMYEDKLYIQTGKSKAVSKQLAANPKAEICACNGGEWIRIECELINDDRIEVKTAMLDAHPNLKSMYKADDDNTQVLYMKNATATISSYTAAPVVIKF